MYSTYGFYITEYGGSTLSEYEFDRACRKASAYIDRITFGRARDYEETGWHELQLCACEMAEAIYEHNNSTVNGKDVISVSNQGYTETYANGQTADFKFRLSDIAMLYLPPCLTEQGV